MPALRLVLGDQLTPDISSLRDAGKDDMVLMAEVKEEATYVKHHRKKIAFLFSAMRHFAGELEEAGHKVRYVRYNDGHNTGSLLGEVRRLLKQQSFDKVVVTEPGEYRLKSAMQDWQQELGCPVQILDDDRFIASHEEFAAWAKNRKTLTMEYWYRQMRRTTGLLMEGDHPAGGSWNYDKDNRKPLKAKRDDSGPMQFKPDAVTRDVLALVDKHFGDHFGDLDPFWFAVTAGQAKRAFSHFVKTALPSFGDYQDAMLAGEPFLYHAIVAQYINCGLLDPLAVCRQVEQAWLDGDVPLNAAEGFIRQIIGWREFIRGVYWLHMPDYAKRNALSAHRPLPDFYWSGKTDMHCMAQVVNMTRQHAYSHHIQRLMVTGNFANLAGLEVEEVCDWYLAVYADAYEWVELPNTLGMALYADGGIVGSKPYISSGAYIDRMSDYCKSCQYNPKKRTGDDACPFTVLYWDYLMRHEQRFAGNNRMAMAYRNLDRFSSEEKHAIRKQASAFLDAL